MAEGGHWENFEFLCAPCDEDGRYVEADFGFCKDCSDYFCKKCYTLHRRAKPLHRMSNKINTPNQSASSRKKVQQDRCTDTCQKHPGIVIDFYCHGHDTFSCNTCALADHRNCKNTDHIPDVAGDIDKTNAFKYMIDNLHNIESEAIRSQQTLKHNETLSEENTNAVISAAQAHTKEMIYALQKLYKDLKMEAQQTQATYKKRLEAAKTRSHVTLVEVRSVLRDLDTFKQNRQYCNLFVALKKAQWSVQSLKQELDRANCDSIMDEYKFEPGSQLQDVLRYPGSLGTFEIACLAPSDRENNSNTSDDHDSGQNVENANTMRKISGPKTFDDNILSHKPKPANIAKPPGGNLIFVKHKRVTCAQPASDSYTPAESIPSSIVKPTYVKSSIEPSVGSSKAAAPLHLEDATRDMRKNITAQHETDILVKCGTDQKMCWITGISSLAGDMLVISDFANAKVKVIDLQKRAVVHDTQLRRPPWDITTVTDATVAVTMPDARTIEYMNVSTDGSISISRCVSVNGACYGIACARERLWVSYRYPVKVEALALDGEVQLCVRQDVFKDPRYIARSPDSETVYVSDCFARSIVRLSPRGKIMSILKHGNVFSPTGIATAVDGDIYVCDFARGVYWLTSQCEKIIVMPTNGQFWGLAYSEASEQLYLGQWNDNNIKVYKLEEKSTR